MMPGLRLISGDLWEPHRNGAVSAIMTGGLIKKNGCCAMPGGTARQAAEKFITLPYVLGEQIRKYGLLVFDPGQPSVSFPVENSPYHTPELKIIARSCREPVELADYKSRCRIVVPRPGCGPGGLLWSEVEPFLKRHFDDRFPIISNGEADNEICQSR